MVVWIKEPGAVPRRRNIKGTLDDLQSLVGGYIETVTLNENDVIICNEEGLLKNLAFNTTVITSKGSCSFVGTIVLAGIKGDGFTDAYHGLQSLGDLYCRTYLTANG